MNRQKRIKNVRFEYFQIRLRNVTVGNKVFMRQHNAFRSSRRSGSEQNSGGIVFFSRLYVAFFIGF